MNCCNIGRVGDAASRGISGGEKKRLSIACELIVDPAILFLDEPTSGLDAFTALNLIHTLSLLAKSGRTVICTIHQPRFVCLQSQRFDCEFEFFFVIKHISSSGIFDLFDKLLLLAEGEVAYFGKAQQAVHCT
jgi:ABC-type multidrug transport system ATPase subunit